MKNERVRGTISVASIVYKMRGNRARWFGHVMKRKKVRNYKNGLGNKRRSG